MSFVSLLTGRLHDRRERPLLMMGLALSVSGIFMAASGLARGEYDFLLFRLLHTTGDSIFNLITLVVAAMIFPRHRSGGAFAFVLTINTASYFKLQVSSTHTKEKSCTLLTADKRRRAGPAMCCGETGRPIGQRTIPV